MGYEERFEHFFKPEIRRAGETFFEKKIVVLTSVSDTGIQGYVRGQASSKVSLKTESIGSSTFSVNCSCPRSEKGHFCKHIWAVLLEIEKKYPDFLDAKSEIEMAAGTPKAASPLKARQADVRKQQYQKQKERAKDQRLAKRKSKFAPPDPTYPDDVADALGFFNQNGFPIGEPFDLEILKEAKRKLSRIFHPDKGGTHDEAVMLNQHVDTLISYFIRS